MGNEETSDCQPARIAFWGHAEFDDGGSYRGAILATDDWGKPLEFRCTAPVKPTSVQRTLYGSTLMPHILVELIAKPLTDALNEKPAAVLVSEPLFLGLRYKVDVPVVWIRRQSLDIKVTTEADNSDGHTILMDCESGRFEPVIMESHWEFPQDTDSCARLLKELFGRWDIVEPFERLYKGLEYVHNEKVLAS
jgi:hypothetical protein